MNNMYNSDSSFNQSWRLIVSIFHLLRMKSVCVSSFGPWDGTFSVRRFASSSLFFRRFRRMKTCLTASPCLLVQIIATGKWRIYSDCISWFRNFLLFIVLSTPVTFIVPCSRSHPSATHCDRRIVTGTLPDAAVRCSPKVPHFLNKPNTKRRKFYWRRKNGRWVCFIDFEFWIVLTVALSRKEAENSLQWWWSHAPIAYFCGIQGTFGRLFGRQSIFVLSIIFHLQQVHPSRNGALCISRA